jgi:hypothetical protein
MNLEGQFLHEKVDILIDFKSLEVILIAFESHEETTE